MTEMTRRDWLNLTLGSSLSLALPWPAALAREGLVTKAIPSSGEKLPVIGLGSSATFSQVARQDDVAALAEVLCDARRRGGGIGAGDVLERYARWRRFDTAALAAATDGLNRLFSNDSAPLRLIRDFGLGLVDRLPRVKRVFADAAAGAPGPSPRLVAGEPI